MNDEFLYRLRADPPSTFALRLKSRLDRQAAKDDGRRVSGLRLFVVASLIGAAAFAMMSPAVRERASALIAAFRSAEEVPAPVAGPASPDAAVSARHGEPRNANVPGRESPFGPPATAARRSNEANPQSAAGIAPASGSSDSSARTQVPSSPPAGRLRNEVTIVGSAIVYPFSKTVSEEFRGLLRNPRFEISDNESGFEQFCKGQGVRFVDIVQATRSITQREIDGCASTGITPVHELKVGYRALTVVTSLAAVPMQLTRGDLYRALARNAPEPSATLANVTRTWQDVESSLPNLTIEILGPVLAADTRDGFTELMLQPGCATYPWHDGLRLSDRKKYQRVCSLVRDDGVYLGMGGDGRAVLRRLEANAGAIAIVDYSFLERNRDRVMQVPIDGVLADPETIANGRFPLSRPLYLYVKGSHLRLVRDLSDFVEAYAREDMIGPRGALVRLGLVPLADGERGALRSNPFAIEVIR